MKVGDAVRIVGGDYLPQQVWIVKSVKSDARGIWIQLKDSAEAEDVWHNASYYEVANELR